ncbi:Na+/H+ antiporter NhaC [Litorivivens sp.]|uniref:Na+/H+ antiporter NhaC n=1 Tax=Litorivivens sp. TaxID=2020868 RepID=UPI0035679771
MPTPPTSPSLKLALLPLALLLLLLAINVALFEDSAIEGPNQIALILAGVMAALIGLRHGASWVVLQDGMLKVVFIALMPILMLLLIGAMASTWMVSGIVPTLIVMGLKLADPAWFYAAAALVCAIVSTAVGSSWTTAATIGVAMMATGEGLGMSLPVTAGAVISGAYFGDKLSPLSDTTNLASGVCGVDLFHHVRYLFLTTVPSFLIALALFIALGLTHTADGRIAQSAEMINAINTSVHTSAWLLLVPLLVVIAIIRKMPALPLMLFATLLGTLCSLLFQSELVYQIGGSEDWIGLYRGLTATIVSETSIVTGNAFSDDLLSTSGMAGMLNTIWLILCAVVFGGLMEASGCLSSLLTGLNRLVRGPTSLVATTSGTCGVLNLTASEQYLTLLIAGRMYPELYKKYGLTPRNLSRTLEDSGTVTSVLVPWNTCGAYHATVLGVGTLTYLPFCFFNLISPLMTVLVMRFGWKVEHIAGSEQPPHTDPVPVREGERAL